MNAIQNHVYPSKILQITKSISVLLMKSLHQSPSNPKIRLKWDRFPCIKSKTSEELIPDDEEIQQCLQDFKKTRPIHEISAILTFLYKNFVLGEQIQQYIRCLIQQKKTYLKQKDQQQQNNQMIIKLNHLQSISSIPSEEQQHFFEKQIVVKALCTTESGFLTWKSQIKHSKLQINPLESRYNRLCDSIALVIFKKIQNLYHEYCQRIEKKCSREEIRAAFAYITNFNEKLPNKQRESLLKIIKSTYGLESSTISTKELKQLYNILLNTIRGNQNRKTNQKDENQEQIQPSQKKSFGLQHIWCRKMQQKLLEIYRTDRSFVAIKETFKEMYPKHTQLFTCESLRSQLRKSIRAALRKVKHYLKHYDIQHQLNDLRDRQMQSIMRTGNFVDLRLKLIDLYLRPGCEREEVKRMADSMLEEIVNYTQSKNSLQSLKERRQDNQTQDGLYSYKKKNQYEETMNEHVQGVINTI